MTGWKLYLLLGVICASSTRDMQIAATVFCALSALAFVGDVWDRYKAKHGKKDGNPKIQ